MSGAVVALPLASAARMVYAVLAEATVGVPGLT